MTAIGLGDSNRIVEYIAQQVYQTAHKNGDSAYGVEDLKQAGNAGLQRAAVQFKPERGVKFTTFAFLQIRWAILDFLNEGGTLIRRPRWYREILAEVDRAQELLRQSRGQEPTSAQLAAALDITLQRLQELESYRLQRVSSEGLTIQQATGPTPEDGTHRRELGKIIDALKVCLAKLPPALKTILELREFEKLSLREVAQRQNLSIGRVHSLQHQGRQQLRTCLQKAGWTVDDV